MIRKAQTEDLVLLEKMARKVAENLHQLGIDQWSATYPSLSNFRSDLEKGGLYVAVCDGIVVGSLSILEDTDEVYQSILWQKYNSKVIHRVMVDPQSMRGGIGTELMQFSIDFIRKQGYESIKIDTHPDNYRMIAFLQKFGFVQGGYLSAIHRIAFELVF
jgi:ribosomal protein S18 acetylase RimI-like enzyme